MQKLLKYTYLLDVKKIDRELRRLWKRYQDILKRPDWESLNEARAILYLTGDIYCEKIAPGAIRKRLCFLKKPISLKEFLSKVDSRSEDLDKLREENLFQKLENFYILVKEFKNKNVGGKFYLDEEKFIKLYNKFNPDKKLKIGYGGR